MMICTFQTSRRDFSLWPPALVRVRETTNQRQKGGDFNCLFCCLQEKVSVIQYSLFIFFFVGIFWHSYFCNLRTCNTVTAKLLSTFLGVTTGKQRKEQRRRQEKMTLGQTGAEREPRHHAKKGQQVALDGERGLSPRLWSKSSSGFFFCFILSGTGFCPTVSCSSEAPCPVGVSVSAAGQKGPGRQCSLAFLQDPNDAERRPIKGLLPLELRGSRKGVLMVC